MDMVRERAVRTGTAATGVFHVCNTACALTVPRQHQIIKAGLRIREVSDYIYLYLKKETGETGSIVNDHENYALMETNVMKLLCRPTCREIRFVSKTTQRCLSGHVWRRTIAAVCMILSTKLNQTS